MRSKRFLHKPLVLLALVPALFALTACQYFERLEEEESTLEAEEIQPAPSPIASETPVEEPASPEAMDFVNDLFSVAYPAGWVALEHEDGSGVILANSESSLDRYRQGAELESGDQALNISLTPAELYQALFIPIEPGSSAGELSEALLTKLGGINGTEAVAAEIVTLEDGREVAIQRAANNRAEGSVILFEIFEGVIALTTVTGYPGEYEEAEGTALAILLSLDFGGTVETLTVAIDPVPPMEGPTQ